MVGIDVADPGPYAEADRFARRGFSLWRRFAMKRDRKRSLRTPMRSSILERWDGTAERGQRLALFSHFDPQGRIDPYVVRYLEEIRACSFDVVLVSSAPRLERADVDRILPLCTTVLRRSNIGLDFGSWHDAIGAVPGSPLDRYHELLLANDSVYGPLRPLAPIFTEMSVRACDFWGLTDCHRMGHHVQSYFLLMKTPVLRSEVFRRFWRDFVFFSNKDNIIRDYEVGLSGLLRQGGLRGEVYCPATALEALDRDASARRGLVDERVHGLALDSSPPISFWKALLLRQGYPFVKRELVRDNPYRLPSLATLPQVVKDVGSYDVDLMTSHLKRLRSAR